MKCKSSLMASCFSGFTNVQEIRACRRFARLSTRLLLTFALAWSCILCSGQLALADTTPEDVLNRLDGTTTIEKLSTEKDVVLVEDEWPDGVVESSIKSKATPEGLVFAAKSGSKVALRIATPDPVGPALTVLKSILSAVYTRNQAIWGIEQDLAWRWYQHEDKRAKVPVLSKNDHLFAALGTPTFVNAGNAQKQYDTWYSHAQQFYPIPMGYKLASFDGGDWNPTGTFNIDDYQQYASWYNYFEDVVETPETPNENGVYACEPTLFYSTNRNNGISDNQSIRYKTCGSNIGESGWLNKDIVVKFNNTQWANVLNNHDLMIYVSSDTGFSNRQNIYMWGWPKGNYTITKTMDSQNENYYTRVQIQSNAVTYYKRFDNIPIENQNGQLVMTINDDFTMVQYSSMNQIWNEYGGPAAVYDESGQIGGDSGGNTGSNDPVYFEPTQDTIKPLPPTVSTESPTYITYNQISNTTTTVDLQPILDAIRNLDRNVQIGFDNVITAIETCCENMRAFLNAWLTDIFNWYDLILNELQKQTRWLEAIYYSKANDVIVQPDNETDEGVDLQIQWENNLSQLEKKFPLSIPWDLYGVLALLDAPPQAPVFELPVVMTEYTVEVDLSDFEPMASISRKFSVLLFVVGLLMNTKKLISITIGEGMPD